MLLHLSLCMLFTHSIHGDVSDDVTEDIDSNATEDVNARFNDDNFGNDPIGDLSTYCSMLPLNLCLAEQSEKRCVSYNSSGTMRCLPYTPVTVPQTTMDMSTTTTTVWVTQFDSMQTYCNNLRWDECRNAYADDGTAICSPNVITKQCYAVAALAEIPNLCGECVDCKEEKSKSTSSSNKLDQSTNGNGEYLIVIIRVLGALLVVTVLIMIVCGYCLFRKGYHHLPTDYSDTEGVSPMDIEMDKVPMITITKAEE